VKVVSLLIALAVAGLLAATTLAAAPLPATGVTAKVPPKCVKWGKKNGKKVCLKRAKPKVKPKPKPKPTPPPPPTQPPAPTAPSGQYATNTSQNSTLKFTVGSDAVSGFAVGEVDSTCNPGAWLNGNHLTLTGAAKLDANGHFAITFPISFTGGGTGSLQVDGTITTAGNASGTMSYNASFTSNGTAYTCSSGSVTWTGGTGGAAATPPTGPQLGHYVGTTTQNSRIQFDLVVQDGYLSAINVALDEIDESCTPSATLALTGLYFGAAPFFVNASGHMRYTYADDSQNFLLEMAIDSSGHATGSANHTVAIPSDGTTYSCASGPVSFTAARG
jgi:hypothetical protein